MASVTEIDWLGAKTAITSSGFSRLLQAMAATDRSLASSSATRVTTASSSIQLPSDM